MKQTEFSPFMFSMIYAGVKAGQSWIKANTVITEAIEEFNKTLEDVEKEDV